MRLLQVNRSRFGALAREALRQFRHLEPAQLGGFDVAAVASDALGELGEVPRVAGEEVGIVQCPLVGGDRNFQPLDLAGQAVKVTLILIA